MNSLGAQENKFKMEFKHQQNPETMSSAHEKEDEIQAVANFQQYCEHMASIRKAEDDL